MPKAWRHTTAELLQRNQPLNHGTAYRQVSPVPFLHLTAFAGRIPMLAVQRI